MFNIYSQVFFLFFFFSFNFLRKEYEPLGSLHSAGANPPLEAQGNLTPSCGCDLSTGAFLQALKDPQWTEGLSLLELSYIFNYSIFSKKKTTQELLPEPRCLCGALSPLLAQAALALPRPGSSCTQWPHCYVPLTEGGHLRCPRSHCA